jgi:DNA-binding response OmpR family regulator
VYEAPDAAASLAILEREPAIQLLLTDLGLPGGMDGKMLAERARECRPALIVVMTTAYAGGALIHEGRLDENVELLSKPFTFAALANCVRTLLDRKGADRARCARILVVEDEPLVRMFVVDALAEEDFATEEAGSFADAMSRLRSAGDEIAAAIVDLGLPDRSGAELVAEIRSFKSQLPIILATGFADDAIRQRFSQDAYTKILEKPFDRAILMSTLHSLVKDGAT